MKEKKERTDNNKLLFKAKKSLGQNFLFNKYYLQKIISYLKNYEKVFIIEIGAGYGSLTDYILSLDNFKKLISLEKDKKLFDWLLRNKSDKRLVILNEDALKVSWEKILFENGYQTGEKILLVGNLPYSIVNTLLVDLLINYRKLFTHFFFLIQKELSEKLLLSKYNDRYSATTVFLNYLAEIKKLFVVPSTCFFPIPKVDGSFVNLNLKSFFLSDDKAKEKEILQKFLTFLKICFNKRRKTLWNNLYFHFDIKIFEKIDNKFNAEFLKKVRPQNLSPGEYWDLFEIFS